MGDKDTTFQHLVYPIGQITETGRFGYHVVTNACQVLDEAGNARFRVNERAPFLNPVLIDQNDADFRNPILRSRCARGF